MQSMTTQPAPSHPWTDLAASMLNTLGKPCSRSRFFTERPRPADAFDPGDDDFADALPDLDALLDQTAETPDVLETHSPRPAPLIALLRLARTFESFEIFWATLTAPGAILLLSTGRPEQDVHVAEVLEQLIRAQDNWPPHRKPWVCKVKDAVRNSVADAGGAGSLEDLSLDFRIEFEAGSPLILIGASAATLPKPLITLSPRDIQIAPLDRDILCEYLQLSFPKDACATPDAIRESLSVVTPELLTLADLMVATRVACTLEAGKLLCERTQPKPQEAGSPRLQDFPLPGTVRDALDQLIEDMRLWRAGQLDWEDVMRGILLHGPTGSGKTEIARLLAREAGISVHAGSLSKWKSSGSRSGEATREMRKFFEAAAGDAPCVIFVDELDALGDRARPHDHNSSWTDGIVTGFLDCVDGFEQLEGVVMLAATNNVEKLDAAILRPGRFDRLLRLGYPSREMLPRVFRWHLKSDLPDADLSALSNKAIGMSGAVIGGLVREARARARRKKHPLTLDDLDAALAAQRPERPQAHRHLVAVHEAGHALVAAVTGAFKPLSVAILSDGGVIEQKPVLNVLYRKEIDAEIQTLLGGRAAEKLVFGQVSGGAGGPPDSDLARATERATALELSYGLGSCGPVWLGAPREMVAYLHRDPAMRGIIQQRLAKLEAAAMGILKQNRDVLDDLAAALLRDGVIHGQELDQYMSRLRGAARPEGGPEDRADMAAGTAC